ncbi:MAG: RNA methyltransferase [Cyanothece sp. SIO2G6]|nr:RNA methyltransferase [Cyanothece sp. SIO2G6]
MPKSTLNNAFTESSSPFAGLQHHLRVVLVEPAGGLNVGAIARVMKNMGLSQLVVVNPKCDLLGTDARQMAVHALDVLAAATIVTTIPEALNGCQRVVATSARSRDLAIPVDPPDLGLQWLLEPLLTRTSLEADFADFEHTSSASPIDGAMVFGPEDRGLSNAELIHAQRLVMIPSSPAYASLNLAQAVAICCYEVYRLVGAQRLHLHLHLPGESQEDSPGAPQIARQTEKGAIAPPTPPALSPQPSSSVDSPTPIPSRPHSPDASPASIDALEGFYQQLETVLLDIGYLYPHTAQRRMEKFRLLFNRSQLTPNEVAMLRGILRQITWAARSPQA